MEFTYFVGTDVSKSELDFSIMQGNVYLYHKEISNTPAAIKSFIKELFRLPDLDLKNVVFCMEHTGIYTNFLLSILHEKQIAICLEAATQIKNSLGNLRGKNDKVDSLRIAEYAYKNRTNLRLWKPKREVIQQLAHLSAIRSRLILVQKTIKTPLKETGLFLNDKQQKMHSKLCQKTTAGLQTDLKNIDKEIDAIIKSDPELKRLFTIVTSVVGIGKITATMIIVTTNEFKSINDPKKFACYAGVVPFVNESGIFKGKGRVSHIANKKLKMLLHLGAINAISTNPQMKAYYERKVNQEQKNKMSTINAVRNKLVLAVFACVKQNRLYEKDYLKAVA